MLSLAESGAGTALLPVAVGEASDQLQRTDPPVDTLRHHQWLVMHPDGRERPAVRSLVERPGSLLETQH